MHRGRRVAAVWVLLVACALPVLVPWSGAAGTGQDDPSPAGTPISDLVRSGDWTFQLLAAERHESYYAERLGRVFEPDGVFLIVALSIRYDGSSPNQLDRFLPATFRFAVTTPDGGSYPQSAEAYAAFGVEESYRQDTPYPPMPGNGVAEPGITYFERFIFDVPADATGLRFYSGDAAPEPFALPLPDPPSTEGNQTWEFTVTGSDVREALGPPAIDGRYDAEGVYVVVFVRLTKLLESPGGFSMGWFALRAVGGDEFAPAVEETLTMGAPSATGEPGTWEFALVFDVPEEAVASFLTLVSIPGSPIVVEIPLFPTEGPTPEP